MSDIPSRSVLKRLSVQLFDAAGNISCGRCRERFPQGPAVTEAVPGLDPQRLARWSVASFHLAHE